MGAPDRLQLRVLVIEDSEDDAALLIRAMKRDGVEAVTRRVDTAEDLRAALKDGQWDVVTCDYVMPHFSGPAALKVLHESGQDLPFIVVSGKVGEETAVDMLKAGAHDFIEKGRLARLVPAMRREMREAESRHRARLAQSILEQSESRFRLITRVSPVGIFQTDAEGNCLYVNERWCEIAGLTSEQAMAEGWAEALHPDDHDRVFREWQRCTAGKLPFAGEFRFRKADDAVTWVIGRAQPEVGDSGEVTSYIGTITDVTALKNTYDDLRRSEQRLREAQRVAHVGSWYLEGSTMKIRWDEEIYRMLGVDATSPPSYTELAGLFTPESFAGLNAAVTKAFESGASYELDLEMIRPGGTRGWMLARGEAVRDGAGRIVGLRGTAMDITERKNAERAVEGSEARFRALTENSSDLIVVLDAAGKVAYVSPSLTRMGGYRVDEALGRRWSEFLHPDDLAAGNAAVAEMLAKPGAARVSELRYRRKDGTWIWLESVSTNALDDPAVRGLVVNARDITERRLQEERIARLTRIRTMLSAINSAIVRLRDRKRLFDEACRIAVEDGKFVAAWIGAVDSAGRVEPAAYSGKAAAYLDALRGWISNGSVPTTKPVVSRQPLVSNDIAADPEFPQPYRERALAEGFRAAASFPLFLDEAVVGVFVLYSADAGVFDADELLILQELASDISYALDYMAKADRVSYMAHYDVLTGLPNRALLMDRMVQYLTHAKGLGESAAFFLVDVQRFRNVNDTFGRHVGDEVLKVIASRLSATIGDESSVARVGNDLFAFIGKNVSGEREAMEIAKKALNECFAPPMTIDGRELRLAGRLGVSLFPSDAAGADTLYRDAEAALAKAKKEGQEYLFYSPEMTARVADKLGLENRLRHAIEAREFVLHYQPKFNARTGALSSVEALIRWQEPSGKLVPPNDFIPLLEETSLILPVGEWALHEAVRQRTAWRSQGLAAPRIAVNVSALQLRSKDFVAVLERVVGGVPDHGIDLEITESLIMTDVEDNIQKLTVAKRMGMRIFVDDFGTGYSSLRYIAKLPLDALKIDRSFIVAMASSPEDMTIVSSIVSLGRDLNLKVVAEGVDSEEQAKLLRLLKCDELQGFLFSRPVPADKIAEMLRRPERVAAPTV